MGIAGRSVTTQMAGLVYSKQVKEQSIQMLHWKQGAHFEVKCYSHIHQFRSARNLEANDMQTNHVARVNVVWSSQRHSLTQEHQKHVLALNEIPLGSHLLRLLP